MKDFIENAVKKFLIFYWHHSQAYSLITLPMNGLGALSAFLLALDKLMGVSFPVFVYWTIYILSTPVLFLVAVWLKKIKMLAFWQSLGNEQNDMLKQIHEVIVLKKDAKDENN